MACLSNDVFWTRNSAYLSPERQETFLWALQEIEILLRSRRADLWKMSAPRHRFTMHLSPCSNERNNPEQERSKTCAQVSSKPTTRFTQCFGPSPSVKEAQKLRSAPSQLRLSCLVLTSIHLTTCCQIFFSRWTSTFESSDNNPKPKSYTSSAHQLGAWISRLDFVQCCSWRERTPGRPRDRVWLPALRPTSYKTECQTAIEKAERGCSHPRPSAGLRRFRPHRSTMGLERLVHVNPRPFCIQVQGVRQDQCCRCSDFRGWKRKTGISRKDLSKHNAGCLGDKIFQLWWLPGVLYRILNEMGDSGGVFHRLWAVLQHDILRRRSFRLRRSSLWRSTKPGEWLSDLSPDWDSSEKYVRVLVRIMWRLR